MKIVTWNCNGALRKKTQEIDRLDADVVNGLGYGHHCKLLAGENYRQSLPKINKICIKKEYYCLPEI